MTFLCPKAPHPDPKKDGKWISKQSWYRKKPAGTPSFKECRCKAKLLVIVSKSENRDVAILLHPHDCGGGGGIAVKNDDNEEEEEGGDSQGGGGMISRPTPLPTRRERLPI